MSQVLASTHERRVKRTRRRRRREVHIAMIYLWAFSRLSLRPASGSLSTISKCESINHPCEPFPSHRRRRKKRNETDSVSQCDDWWALLSAVGEGSSGGVGTQVGPNHWVMFLRLEPGTEAISHWLYEKKKNISVFEEFFPFPTTNAACMRQSNIASVSLTSMFNCIFRLSHAFIQPEADTNPTLTFSRHSEASRTLERTKKPTAPPNPPETTHINQKKFTPNLKH